MIVRLPQDLELAGEAKKLFSEQVYYLSPVIESCRFVSQGLEVSLNGEPDDPDALGEQIIGLAQRVAASYQRVETQILDSHQGEITFDQDPYPELVETRQVMPSQPGVYAFQGLFLQVMQALDAFFRDYALDIGSIEQAYPVTVPTTSLVQNGYLSGFPQNAMFASSIQHKLESIEFVANALSEMPDHAAALAGHLGSPDQALSPTVCYHCFETLRGRTLPAKGTVFTAVGLCHRHESSNIQGLTRLQTYNMREIIFYGAQDFVLDIRQKVLEHCMASLSQWDLTCRVATATDPFFATGADMKRSYQALMGLKYELQTYIPFSDSWLSVASFNNHQRSLVTSYDITCKTDDETLSSGCVGYGYERLAFSIFSQFGCDPRKWPAPLGELIK